MASPPSSPEPTWEVRIQPAGQAGAPVGAGVLLTENRLLTCAHVVHHALGEHQLPRSAPLPTPAPTARVLVDSPTHARTWSAHATVLPEHWHTRGQRPNDIAILQLEHTPPELSPAKLRPIPHYDAYPETRVRARGFSRQFPNGLTTHAVLRGPGGDSPGLVQLQLLPQDADLEQGLSGCGVVDIASTTVVGIFTSLRRKADGRSDLGWMIPVEEIPAVQGQVITAPLNRFDELNGHLDARLRELDMAEVAECFVTALSGRSLRDAQEFDNAWTAFQHLNDLTNTAEGTPRTVVFIEHIALRCPELGRVLRRWTEAHPDYRLFHANVHAIRTDGWDTHARSRSSVPVPANPAWLIMCAEVLDTAGPPGTEPPEFLVTHWVRYVVANRRYETEAGRPHRVSYDQLRSHMLTLIHRTEKMLANFGNGDLRLEFILPLALLTEPIPEWPAPESHDVPGPRLGARFEIVLRSWERCYDPAFRSSIHRWRQRWQELHQGSTGVSWPPEHTVEHHNLAEELARPGIVGRVLTEPPDREQGRDELMIALSAGLPIITWRRPAQYETTKIRRRSDNHFRDWLGQTIVRSRGDHDTESGLVSLPRQLRIRRTVTPRTPLLSVREHDPYDIALMYDDPTQIPDIENSVRFTSPRCVSEE